MKIVKRVIKYSYCVLCNLSPRVEVSLRKLYWNNIHRTKSYAPNNVPQKINDTKVDFEKILDLLKNDGIKKDDFLIIHSSYDALERTELSPEEINQKLIDFVGIEGTIAMPIIRKYKEEGSVTEYLKKNLDDIVCTYNVQRSKITSGFLPYTLMARKDSHVSRFPLNPMVAVGKYAKAMMEHNLDGEYPSPHGENSAWKYCYDKDAIVIGLGINQIHYLTIMHVSEEAFKDWPIKNWYRKRTFNIVDREFKTQIQVSERDPKWGTIYLAEHKFKKDLIKNKILRIQFVDGVEVSIVSSKKLIEFLRNNKHIGYPYYVPKKDLR